MFPKFCRYDGTQLVYIEPTPFTPPEGVKNPLHCTACDRIYPVRVN